MLQVADSQQIRKLNEYKQEEQNLNRLVQNKTDANPNDHSNMRVTLGNFYLRESNN